MKNTAIIAANRLGSMGDQGRVFGSDGKDLANTTRTLIQQWVPLNDFEEHRIADSAIRRYGELRHTPQQFLEGEDSGRLAGNHGTGSQSRQMTRMKKRRGQNEPSQNLAVLGSDGCDLSHLVCVQ